jgi:hypothetical protein
MFGAAFGVALGTLTMFINGFLSPWGVAGVVMPYQMAGMALIGFMGGVYRRVLGKNPVEITDPPRILNLEVSFLAAFLTLVYDVITNIGWALPYGVPIIVALIQGAWFTVVHVASNIVFFGSAFFILVRVISNLIGENPWSFRKEV